MRMIPSLAQAAFLALASQPLAHALAAQIPRDHLVNGRGFHLDVRDDPLLQVQVQNNFGDGPQLKIYMTAKVQKGNALAPALLKQNGDAYEWFFLDGIPISGNGVVNITEPGLGIDVASGGLTFNVPSYVTSSRIYLSRGELTFGKTADGGLSEPSPTNPSLDSYGKEWGFVELNNQPADGGDGSGLYINLSFVDWVGMALGVSATSTNETVETVEGLPGDVFDKICKDLDDASKTPSGVNFSWWANLCQKDADGKILRILSPNMYLTNNPQDAADVNAFYTGYVDTVWKQYGGEKNNTITVDTQVDCGIEGGTEVDSGASTTDCTVIDDLMTCVSGGDEITKVTYPKPGTGDILSCNTGAFAPGDETVAAGDSDDTKRKKCFMKQTRARLCAAFVRSTLMLENVDANIQPNDKIGPDQYYTDDITDHYSRIVHQYLINNRGYTFSFDDVHANKAQDSAGVIRMGTPQKVLIQAGGWKE